MIKNIKINSGFTLVWNKETNEIIYSGKLVGVLGTIHEVFQAEEKEVVDAKIIELELVKRI